MRDRNLFLVRHGSVLNPARLVYGRLPGFPLSSAGQQEAAAAARHLAAFDIERVFSSIQERALETASIIARACACPVSTDSRLVEVANEREGQPFVPAPESRSEIQLGPAQLFLGAAESRDDLLQRLFAALEAALASTRRDVVLVSHQVPLAVLLREWGVGGAVIPDLREGSVVRIVPEDSGTWEVGFVPGPLARVEMGARSAALLHPLRARGAAQRP